MKLQLSVGISPMDKNKVMLVVVRSICVVIMLKEYILYEDNTRQHKYSMMIVLP